MRRLMFGFCLLVAACGAKIDTNKGAFRDAASPIYSNAAFDVAKLAGQWDQVAEYSTATQSGCQAGMASFVPKAGVMQGEYKLCLSGQVVTGTGMIVTTGPGRFSVKGKGGIGQDWWVLWVDEGYRTLAIGTPSGSFGFILNRGTSLPNDRLAAAREVFDFNSYGVERLSVFGNQ
jgi:apolipoprotein D and lipocalin family protein